MQLFCKPDIPVFSKEYNPLFCALIAVGLGCNLNLGGVKSIGSSTMYILLEEINKSKLTSDKWFNCLLLRLSGHSNKKGSTGQPFTVTKSSCNGASKRKCPQTVLSWTVTSKRWTFTSEVFDKHALKILARAFVYESCNEEMMMEFVFTYMTNPPNWKCTCKNLLHQMGV